jgi:hypothetical protein
VLFNTFKNLNGIFNDFTYARFPTWSPYLPTSYYAGLVPHGFGSSLLNINDATNEINSVTLTKAVFANLTGAAVATSSSNYMASILQFRDDQVAPQQTFIIADVNVTNATIENSNSLFKVFAMSVTVKNLTCRMVGQQRQVISALPLSQATLPFNKPNYGVLWFILNHNQNFLQVITDSSFQNITSTRTPILFLDNVDDLRTAVTLTQNIVI